MSKQIVIDWQRNGIVAAVCNQRGSKVTLDKLSRQPVGENTANTTLKQAVAAAAEELGVSKTPVTVVVARELVEVRTISIPRMDEAELPDVIRFQAQRQLANMGDNWPLDFVLLPDAPGQDMQTALVGVIQPADLTLITGACEAAGLTVAHVGLRPLEVARFATQSGHLASKGNSLLISIAGSNADLMLLKDGRVVQVRSTKVPSEPAQLASSIQGEIRRSLMAASAHVGEDPIGSVMLLADHNVASQLEGPLAQAAGAPISTFDPSELVAAGTPAQLDDEIGPRLAALGGAAGLGSAAKAAAVDFLNPKKRPPKKDNRRTYMLAAAAGIVVVAGGLSWWRYSSQANENTLVSLKKQLESTKEKEVDYRARSSQLKEVEQFLDQSPNWLDQLSFVAERIPPSDKVQVSRTSFLTTKTGKTQIMFAQVLADSDTSLAEFEDSLRDGTHELLATNRQQLPEPIGDYRWIAAPVVVTLEDAGWKLTDEIEKGPSKKKDETAKQQEESQEESKASSDETSSEGEPASDASDDKGSDASPSDASEKAADESSAEAISEASESDEEAKADQQDQTETD